MKNLIKAFIITVVLIVAVCSIASCSQWDTPYETIEKDGYNVSVRFDPNGGIFAGTEDVFVVDVFNLENLKTNSSGNKEISLIAPNDPARNKGAYEISKSQSTLVGWYTQKSLRVDENGNALDDYGELVSESKRPQGYTYSGYWDFDNAVLEIDPNKEYTSENSVLTLYAAWVPTYTYELYAQNGNGGFDLYQTTQKVELNIPSWNDKTGKMDANGFPVIEGKTFDGASLSEDFSQLIESQVPEMVDIETGTLKGTGVIKVYTRWLEGTWFKISTAKQFKDNSRLDGNYIILEDLDFNGVSWNNALATKAFVGKIVGNGHKFSNITVSQGDISQLRGGIFGELADGAEITDVAFENLTYKLMEGSKNNGAYFGLLAGAISGGAILDNVSVSGSLKICSSIPNTDYSVGLLTGSVVETGIDISSITVEIVDKKGVADTSGNLTAEIEDTANGHIVLTFNSL